MTQPTNSNSTALNIQNAQTKTPTCDFCLPIPFPGLLSLIYFPGPSVQQARPGALVNTIPSPIPSWLSKVKIKFNPQNSMGPRHSLLPTFSTIHIFPSCSQEFTRSVNAEATACPGSFFRQHKRDPTLFTSCWAVTDFIFLGSQITTDSDSSHEMKRRWLLGRKAMTSLDSILKSRDTAF